MIDMQAVIDSLYGAIADQQKIILSRWAEINILSETIDLKDIQIGQLNDALRIEKRKKKGILIAAGSIAAMFFIISLR